MTTDTLTTASLTPPTLPHASIVIVNKNDEGIADTLDTLHQLGVDHLAQVIVVDASQGRFERLRWMYPHVTWIDFTPTRARSIAQQRNIGLAHAIGEVIVFLDANCVPSEEWFSSLLAPLTTGEDLIVSGGVAPKSGPSVHDAVVPHDVASDGFRREFGTMNVAIPRRVFDVIGNFDEELGFAEDVDLSWRSQDAGFRIVYCPEALIHHEWGDFSDDMERGLRYSFGRARLMKKHPQWRRNLLRSDRATLAYGLFILGLPLTIVFPLYPALLAYPLWKNRHGQPTRKIAYALVYSLGFMLESLGLRR